MKIVNAQTFRSEAKVNMTDNMVRVTVDMTRKEYREFIERYNLPKKQWTKQEPKYADGDSANVRNLIDMGR